MGRIVLHIGMERTGSTALRRFFARHRAALRLMGVRYPRGRDRTGQARDKHQELVDGIEDGTAAAVVAEHAEGAAKAGLTVLTAEGLSAPDPAFAPALAPLADAGDVRIIVYLRRQDEWALSVYRAAVVDGDPGAAVPFAAWLARPDVAARLDYHAMLDRWASVFGAECIRVMLYPHDLPLVPGFVAAAELPRAVALLPDGNRRFRESVGDEELKAALSAAGAAPEVPQFSQNDRDLLMARYARGNEAIRKTYLPDRKTLFGVK